jgi:hypothetical protein
MFHPNPHWRTLVQRHEGGGLLPVELREAKQEQAKAQKIERDNSPGMSR